MSDLKKYISKRKKHDKEFAENYNLKYEEFKIGEIIQQLRESSGLTQKELAEKVQTKKTAISRLENHSSDIRLSTLQKIVKALGKDIQIQIS